MTRDYIPAVHIAGHYIPRRHWHFHSQLLARYGIVLETGEFGRILRSIRDRTAVRLPTTGDSPIWGVTLFRRSEEIRILVAGTGNDLVTVVPMELHRRKAWRHVLAAKRERSKRSKRRKRAAQQ